MITSIVLPFVREQPETQEASLRQSWSGCPFPLSKPCQESNNLTARSLRNQGIQVCLVCRIELPNLVSGLLITASLLAMRCRHVQCGVRSWYQVVRLAISILLFLFISGTEV